MAETPGENVRRQISDFRQEMDHMKETTEEIAAVAKTVGRLTPWLKLLIFGAFGIGTWAAVLNAQLRELMQSSESMAKRLDKHDDVLSGISLWRAETDAQRVTAGEVAVIVSGVKDTLYALDKRQAEAEVTLKTVTEQLTRIETRLK